MKKLKLILKITFYLSVFLGVIVLFTFSARKQSQMLFRSLNINIDRSNEIYFIDEEDIRQQLRDRGDSVIGQAMGKIDCAELENLINNNPAVLKSEVYKSIDGELNIEIKQRKPIVRIFNNKNEGYYLDEKGKMLPLSQKFTSRVLVANGNIFESYDKFYYFDFSKTIQEDSIMKYTRLDELYLLSSFINNDPFWRSQIEQVYVDKDFELIPKVGNHVIILGDTKDLKEKFDKLFVFYKEALPKSGWNKYSTINLKYKNQVICTKANIK
jgi:cell division protein FtsQ